MGDANRQAPPAPTLDGMLEVARKLQPVSEEIRTLSAQIDAHTVELARRYREAERAESEARAAFNARPGVGTLDAMSAAERQATALRTTLDRVLALRRSGG